ncbi:hypothetical protein JNK13_04635 [bacterium]|nr:hypothetical protein [bacterium]
MGTKKLAFLACILVAILTVRLAQIALEHNLWHEFWITEALLIVTAVSTIYFLRERQ